MEEIDRWLINKEDLPEGVVEFYELMCGCGSPILCWDALFTLLQDETFYHIDDDKPFELFFHYVVDHLKFTDHGTSIGGAWITPKGKEVLAWLQAHIGQISDMVVCY